MDIDQLERLFAGGQDNLMLRYGLGSACLAQGETERAISHLQAALCHDPGHSASHKLLGKALKAAGRDTEAIAAYEQGIRVAEARGDVQAVKEMQVFLRRLRAAAS